MLMIAYDNKSPKHPVVSGFKTGAYIGGIAVGFSVVYAGALAITTAANKYLMPDKKKEEGQDERD